MAYRNSQWVSFVLLNFQKAINYLLGSRIQGKITDVRFGFHFNREYLSAINTFPCSCFDPFWQFFILYSSPLKTIFMTVCHSYPFFRLVKSEHRWHTSTLATIFSLNSVPLVRTVGEYEHIVPLWMPILLFLLICTQIFTYMSNVPCDTRATFNHAARYASRSVRET